MTSGLFVYGPPNNGVVDVAVGPNRFFEPPGETSTFGDGDGALNRPV